MASTVADSIRSEQIAPGVRVHHLVRTAAPLRIHVLDVDLSSCVTPHALKGAPTAVGRKTTSELLRELPAADVPIAAVNADFFAFTPNGVPASALIVDGQWLAGPVTRPMLSFDARNRPTIGQMTVSGAVITSRGRVPLSTWNRPTANAIGIVDAAWGQPLDSLSRPGAMQLVPVDRTPASAMSARRYRIAALPTVHSGLARGDTIMLVGSARASVLIGDTVRLEMSVTPAGQRNAVGGFPLLVRDSAIVATVDTDGAASFRGVNPRTAAGFSSNGRRLLLIVIDGRQSGYSVGTTVRETAAIMRDLGARDAVNLDGGGSSALVVRDASTGTIRVMNRPSDAVGERPVGDALAITGRCVQR